MSKRNTEGDKEMVERVGDGELTDRARERESESEHADMWPDIIKAGKGGSIILPVT